MSTYANPHGDGFQSPAYGSMPLPHPCISEPLLYISGLAPSVTEADLARLLEHCAPVRPTIIRDGISPMLNGMLALNHNYVIQNCKERCSNPARLPSMDKIALMMSRCSE